MRKTFHLKLEGKHPDRVLDAIKHEIRQYLRRERRKTLPEGVDFWDFDCRFGANPQQAEPVHVAQLTALIDGVAQQGAEGFYLELLAKAGRRGARPPQESGLGQT